MAQVTARIENWVYDKKQNVIIGNIYGDVHKRWPEGSLCMTSALLPMSMQSSTPHQGGIVITRNSTYLLGEKK